MDEQVEPVVPVEAPIVEQVADPVIEAPESPPPQKPVMVPVAVVADLREKKRGLESQLEAKDRELTEARALLERIQRGDKETTPQSPKPTFPIPTDNNEFQRAVDAAVVNKNIQSVNDSGLKAFGAQWTDTVNALTAFGVNNPDFLVDVMEIDGANAHKIMHDIAQDGEKAVALGSMSKAKRIAEITRMVMNAEPARGPDGKFIPNTPEPAKKVVSKAPAPPPPVEPSASKVVDWRSDEASDDDFTKGFNETMAKRAGRR